MNKFRDEQIMILGIILLIIIALEIYFQLFRQESGTPVILSITILYTILVSSFLTIHYYLRINPDNIQY